MTRDYIQERVHDLKMKEAQSVPGDSTVESLPRWKLRQ
jgi:hypothetical protein